MIIKMHIWVCLWLPVGNRVNLPQKPSAFYSPSSQVWCLWFELSKEQDGEFWKFGRSEVMAKSPARSNDELTSAPLFPVVFLPSLVLSVSLQSCVFHAPKCPWPQHTSD